MSRVATSLAVFVLVVGLATSVLAQQEVSPQARVAAQRDALTVFSFMDGVWRGPAWIMLPTGQRHGLTQTERIGPFLGGAVKVIEGRGYDADGTVSFNALGIISFDPDLGAYSLRSYAEGRVGDFPLTLTADGYTWDIPAGPFVIRYTATLTNGVWHEVGDRVVEGQEPIRFFDMSLTRIGDTDWPAADPVSPE